MEENKINIVTVCLLGGHTEIFKATEVRFDSNFLLMRLEDGNNKSIPLNEVIELRLKKIKE